MMTHLSLFSGIGGLDLAAEMAGFQTVGQCEWADYPYSVLEKHWPGVPKWRDIRALTGESFHERTGLRTVDIISGGFPCQPFSIAGKRRGKEDDRYLWPEMLRVITELRPRWVLGENVAGIVNLALDTVLSDLEAVGYSGRAVIIPACAVDAQHRRDRCAILAHADGCGHLHRADEKQPAEAGKCAQCEPGGRCKDVADTQRVGLREDGHQPPFDTERDYPAHREERAPELREAGRCGRNVSNSDSLGGGAGRQRIPARGSALCHSGGERATQSGLGGVADGISSWLDRCMSAPGFWMPEPDIPRITHRKENRINRLKCLGNAVVPQQFYPVFRYIREIEEDRP